MNTITIGGKAGDGVKSAGKIIAKLLDKYGYYVFVLDDYPSLITGGHNFNKITFSKERITSYYCDSDFLLALDENTIKRHKKELKKKSVIIYDSNAVDAKLKNAVPVPAQDFVREVGGIKIMRNSVLLGALCYLLGADIKILNKLFVEKYREKAKPNIVLAKKGYDFAKSRMEPILKLKRVGKPKKLVTGNEAIAYGAVKAGLDVYVAYPMTPASSILHYLAAKKDSFGIKVIHPENEIAVINMALGSAYAGAKTMIATSGGGFALMTEALSLAGMSETPILIVEAQRPGPSTGVPTYTSQGDLNFVLNAGHGEFPRIVLAPGTQEEAFYKSAEALNLAWKYQVPVILLSDKHLSESLSSVCLDEKKIKKVRVKFAKGNKRYKITKSGVSPLILPGVKGSISKVSSYEHDEFGITTEDPVKIKKMQEKRIRKMELIQKDIEKLECVKIYGKGKKVIVTWGSTIGAVLEAVKGMKNVKVIQIIYLDPFPSKKVMKELGKASKVVCVELNATGQLADLIKSKTGIACKKLLKHDSRQFEPLELSKKLKVMLK